MDEDEYMVEPTTTEDIKDIITEFELYRQHEQEQKDTYFSDTWN